MNNDPENILVRDEESSATLKISRGELLRHIKIILPGQKEVSLRHSTFLQIQAARNE